MSAWELPTTVDVCGQTFAIRSDFRAVLDALAALADPELSQQEQYLVCLEIMYPDWQALPDANAALRAAFTFINAGREESSAKHLPRLVDWEQDAPLIAADINKAAGCEVRALPYLHWWTFMAWFNSIGDGQLATLLRVRSKLRHGQKLQPWEQDYYRKNKAMVDLRPRLNPAEIAERQRLQRLLAN